MNYKLIPFIIGIILSSSLYAQKEVRKDSCKITNSFGYNAGFTTGLGLSYQFLVNNKWGFQLSGVPFVFSPESHWISVGGTGIYKIRDNKKTDLVAYVGAHLISSRSANMVYPMPGPADTSKIDYDYTGVLETKTLNQLNIGAGIGFEFDLGRSFFFNLMGGFGGYNINHSAQIYPSLEIALFYKL